jgi:hypothetical protein
MHEDVHAATTAHLSLLDRRLPGRAVGLYLTGGVALADYRPPHSDIDAVVVLDRPASDEDIDVLREVHAGLPATPAYDVTYLTREQVAAPPTEGLSAPFTLHGLFDDGLGGTTPATPVLWAELARHALAVREVPGLRVADDHAALRRHALEHLTTYWLPWLEDADRHLGAGRVGAAELEMACTWPVFGVPRLHALLALDAIVSKSAAAAYAAATFPEHAAAAERALAHRHGEPQAFTGADARAATALGRGVVADAAERWRQVGSAAP